MNQLTIFVMQGCPYCRNAQRAVEELTAGGAYPEVAVEWIDENEQPEVAERYDYYYVPSVYAGEEKLYECDPSHDYGTIREHLRQAFDGARPPKD